MTNRLMGSFLLLAMTASPAWAVVLEDFESGYAGPGTLITDPADAGNTALHLVSHRGEAGVLSDIFTVDTNGFVGKVTMDIYDFGATMEDAGNGSGGTDHGPRWGIQGDANNDGTLDNWAAAGIIQKPFLVSNAGYTYIADDIADDGQRAFSFNGDWFTVNFYGNPRRVKTDPVEQQPAPGFGLQFIGTGTPEVPQIAGTGAWTTWEFDVDASGNVTITAKDGTDTGLADPKFLDAPYDEDVKTQYTPAGSGPENMVVTNLKQIWVTGGQSDLDSIGFLGSRLGVQGVLVDNVTFDGVMVVQLPGDANDDGTVDLLDLDILGTNFGLTPATFAQGDFNGDNVVDLLDLDILGTNFGNTASSSAAVPEPGSLALLALVALGLAGRRGNKVA